MKKSYAVVITLSNEAADEVRQLSKNKRSKAIIKLLRDARKSWYGQASLKKIKRDTQLSIALPLEIINELEGYNLSLVIESLLNVYKLQEDC